MYAVIELGGRQWKVEPGTRLDVNRITAEVGGVHTVERILLAHDGQQMRVGRPYVEGAKVVCEVIAHRLGPKVVSYHFRRRENWRRTVGHRQLLSRLIVKEVQFPGGAAVQAPARVAEAPKRAATPKPVARAAAAKHPVKPAAKKPAPAKKRVAA